MHYIKMFPVPKEFREKFWTGKDKSYLLYQQIIERNEKRIVTECQAYLNAYERGERPRFSVDIDAVIEKLEQETEGVSV